MCVEKVEDFWVTNLPKIYTQLKNATQFKSF